jgi:dephospho-CoA kinase
MTKSQILKEIRLMQPVERLEVIEFTLRLIREEMTKKTVDEQVQKLSLVDAAEMIRSYYAEASELTEFTDICEEDFCEYQEYA